MSQPHFLLMVPPLFERRDSELNSWQWIPHVGLGYVGGYLKRHGIKLSFIDGIVDRHTPESIAAEIKQLKPDFLGVTATTYQIYDAANLCQLAKSVYPEITTIIGGYHAGAIPKQTLEEFPSFDYAVFGEGEETCRELVQSVRERRSASQITGIAWRDGDNVIKNEARPYFKDMDEIGFPDFSFFPMNKYRATYTIRRGIIEVPIATMRGCPYSCNFCFRSMGQKVRYRSVEKIVDEIKRDVNEYGAKQLIFIDDTLTLAKERIKEMSRRMVKERLHEKVSWIGETRVDHVDKELFREMAKAGCRVLSFGVESGNQAVLDACEKRQTLDEIKQAFAWAKEAGIRIHASFIIGQAYETVETINDTIRMGIDLDPHYVSYCILTPFPGTEVPDLAERGVGGLKYLSKDWKAFGKQTGKALELESVPRQKLESLQRKGYFKFFIRPAKILNMFQLVGYRDVFNYGVYQARQVLKNVVSEPLLQLRHAVSSFLSF